MVFNDNITDVNADSKFNPLDLRYIDIVFGHAALNFDRAAYGIYDTAKLNEGVVPCILDDTSVMLSDFRIEKRLSKSFQLRQRAFFVDPYQAARARDIRRQNSRQSPLYVLAAQDAPPGSGKLNVHIAQLVGRRPAMPMSETGPKAKYSLRAHVFRFTPESGLKSDIARCLKRANNGLLHRRQLAVLLDYPIGERRMLADAST